MKIGVEMRGLELCAKEIGDEFKKTLQTCQPEAGETNPEHRGAHEPSPDDGQSEREMWRKHDRDDPGTDEDADPTVSVRQNLTRNIALNG